MRVISWNLAGAPHTYRVQRYEAALIYLRDHLSADVALLQEVRFDSRLSEVLSEYTVLDCARPGDLWGSAVLVRGRSARSLFPNAGGALDKLTSYLAYAEVEGRTLGVIRVVSVHASPSPAPAELTGSVTLRFPVRRCGAWHSDVIASELAGWLEGQRFIVGGDWNESPSLWDDTYGVEDGAEFFAAVRALGWVDGARHLHQGSGDLRTLFRADSKAYQIDHVFTDPSTAQHLTKVFVKQPAGGGALSDHAPFVLELDC